jgi:AraC family transcriptional regulator
MLQEISELCLAQAGGSLPTALAGGGAPSESGVFVFSARFHGGGHLSATPRLHDICFHVFPSVHLDCRIADQVLSHSPSRGCFAICPYAADGEGTTEAIIVAVDPSRFALAAAEGSAFGAELIDCLSGYDQALFDLARSLAVECEDG